MFLIHFWRTLFMYGAVFILIRIMGKREIGQLSPFDLVVAIMIAELAALPLEQTNIPLTHALVPIVTLMGIEILLAFISLKSQRARQIINGSPTVIIKNGQILHENMRYLRYNVNDLLAQLREKDIFNIADVEFAVLETSGRLSVLPRAQKRPLTPEDMGIQTKYEGIPVPLIIDGVVNFDNLKKANLSYQWLQKELAKQGYTQPKEVVFAALDTTGQLYVSPRQQIKAVDLYENI